MEIGINQTVDTDRIIAIANTPSKYNITSRIIDICGISPTLAARDYKGPVQIAIKDKE